jgi:minor extracellular serine protease Vpr
MILSNRGDCNFTQKSLNSQIQGAKLAVIADNVESENPGRIILADDGRGKQIHIPTIFIEKELGDRIVEFTLKNQ